MRDDGNLARAKGLLLSLMQEAYQRRDHVALLCFAGEVVELRLPPRRASAWNDDWVAPIAAGGGTPLALGVQRALALPPVQFEVEGVFDAGDRDDGASLERLCRSVDESGVETVQRDLLAPMDALARPGGGDLGGIPVGVDRDPRRTQGSVVQTGRIGGSHFDPDHESPGRVLRVHRRLTRSGDPVAEDDAVGVFEAVGQQAREHEGIRLGGMSRDAQRQVLIDPAIDVGQGDLEGVHRRAGGHGDRA